MTTKCLKSRLKTLSGGKKKQSKKKRSRRRSNKLPKRTRSKKRSYN